MGCGSAITQVSDIGREGGFRPLRLLQMNNDGDMNFSRGKIFLFGQTRTHRKIIECQVKGNVCKNISTRIRIPIPKIHLDPLETLYQQSQQIFNLGMYGYSTQPPFNKMLALFLQNNLVFCCGGRDYECFNVKSDTFYYSIIEQPLQLSNQMLHASQATQRDFFKPKHSGNRFQKMAAMNKQRYSHAGLYCSKLKAVVVIGGINQKQEVMNSCEMFNVFENNWKEIATMKVKRSNPHCFLYGNSIYVFGGRSSKEKLSKKIQAFRLDSLDWELIPYKLHIGIEEAFVCSLNPHEVLIMGGRTHSGQRKPVIKIDLKSQGYIWQNEMINEYSGIKGVATKRQIYIFGGKKDSCEMCFNNIWKEGIFQQRKQVELEDLFDFSYTRQSLVVKNTSVQQQKREYNEAGEELFFGNDLYPCLMLINKATGRVRKEAVPLNIRLKSNMGILQYQKNRFMLLGGSDYTEKRCSRSCFFYSRSNKVGTTGIKMSQKRVHFAMIYHKKHVYVFGGHNCLKRTEMISCQRYSFIHDKWDGIADLPKPRFRLKGQVIGGDRIALIGQNKDTCPLPDIDIYDINNNMFQTYSAKKTIIGRISLIYGLDESQSFYVFRSNSQKEYFQQKIELLLNKEQTNSIVNQNRSLDETFKDESSSIFKQLKLQDKIMKAQDIDDESQKIEGVPLKPQMIEIHSKKMLPEEENVPIYQEGQDQFELQKVQFDNKMIQEIRSSSKKFIEEMVKEKEKEVKMKDEDEEDRNTEIRLFATKSSQKSIKIEPNQKLENKLPAKNNDYYSVTKTPKQQQELFQQIKSHKHRIIKRYNTTYFIADNIIITWTPNEGLCGKQKLRAEDNIRTDVLF